MAGRVVKQEADNIFAVFDNPVMALEAALDIFRGFEAMNGVTASENDILGSVGIGYGPNLLIGDDDLFGCELNTCLQARRRPRRSLREILLTSSGLRGHPGRALPIRARPVHRERAWKSLATFPIQTPP